MTASQKAREISVSSVLAPDTLLFRSMRGTDGLSQLFSYDVELLSTRNDVQFDALLGSMMTVSLRLPELGTKGEQREFSGMVSRFALAERQHRYAVYHATIQPWLWLLSRAGDCRIFQEKSVPQILKAVFSRYSIADFDMAGLSADYPSLSYCVQYRETDFAFVSRLMEQEGIYYFFRCKGGRHTMVLVDSQGPHRALEGYGKLPYAPLLVGAVQATEAVSSWRMEGEIQTGAFSLKSFDFEKPSSSNSGALLVKSTVVRKHDQAAHAMFDYPGKFLDRARGEHFAKVRIEQNQAAFQQVSGTSTVRGMAVGSLFSLTAHPRSDQNREYLLTSASYALYSDFYDAQKIDPNERTPPPFLCSFTAIPSAHPFRAPSVTEKPLVQGPQTAMVVGKAGEEIWTDKYGRIKVQFHWDREGKDDEKSSCWVRVAQGWAGKRWGSLFLPRVGQEVIVSFLEGDPDQPLVTGSVYNAVTLPPYALPEHATRSTLKSNSSKGGGGFNELRFEDKKGHEQVFLHAEKDQDNRVKNDALCWIGRDEHRMVTRHQHVQIGGTRHVKVTASHHEKIGASMSLEVGQELHQKVGISYAVDAGKEVHIKGGMNVIIEAGAMITLKAGGAFVVIGPTAVAISGTPILLNSGGSAGSGGGAATKDPTAPKEADDGKK